MLDNILDISLIIISLIFYFIISRLIYEINHPIAKYLKKIVFSDIPILQLSQDENFHTIEKDFNSEKNSYRFSLIMIPFGSFKIYLFSYRNKFEFFKILSLQKIIHERKDLLKIKIEEFLKENILQYDSKKQIESIEILKSDTELYNDLKNTARTKGTFYITLVAALLSIVFTQLKSIIGIYNEICNTSIILPILFWYLIILLINMIVFNLQSMSVSIFIREIYEDYIGDNIKYSKFKFYYTNMNWANFFSQVHVTYIKNIELFLHRSFVISVLFIFVYLLQP